MEQAFERLQSLADAAIEHEEDRLAGLLQDRSRRQIARGELVDEAFALAIDHDRTGAAARLRHQNIGTGAKRGMDLDLIHVHEFGPGLLRQQHPFAGRAGLVRARHAHAFWTVFCDHFLVGAETTCSDDDSSGIDMVARGSVALRRPRRSPRLNRWY